MAATADDVPFGGKVRVAGGEVVVRLDVDRGELWAGERLQARLIVDGDRAPGVAATEHPAWSGPRRSCTSRSRRHVAAG